MEFLDADRSDEAQNALGSIGVPDTDNDAAIIKRRPQPADENHHDADTTMRRLGMLKRGELPHFEES